MTVRLRRKNLTTIILTAFLILMAAFAMAGSASAATTATVDSKEGLNVRSGPGVDYGILFALPDKTTVTVIEKDGGWYKISYEGKTGYASGDYLVIQQTGDSDGDVIGKTGTVNSLIGLNVRSGPGSGYELLFTLNNNATVDIIGKSGSWYQISYNGRTGYVSSEYIVIDESPDYVYDGDFESYLTQQGFPESYKYYLRILHAAHPQWIFKSQKTGLSWTDVIDKESKVGINLVHKSSNDSWKSDDYGAKDSNGNYIEFDSGGWIAASRSIVEYYMDPRNFLNEGGIFQFMSHSYDSQTQTKAGLQQLVAGTFLANKFPEAGYDTYSDALIYAGSQSGANPYVLASMILVEQGKDGKGNSISGKVSGFEGYYNYFNVRAYASGGYDAVEYGLLYAKSQGWNTHIKSILGGAAHYASNYIKNNQNTLYLKKFNVMNGMSSVATHQYMTNIGGAASEAANLKAGYSSSGAITFYIPVYSDMPETAAPMPGSGNNNYFLKSLSVDGYDLMPAFNMYTSEYELVVPSDTSHVKINASASDSGAKVEGAGNVQLTGNVTDIKVTVTSTSGVKKTYTITVAKESGSTSEGSLTSSVYSIGTYITGVDFETSVKTFKSNLNISSGCSLKVISSGGSEMTSGNVGTGTKAVLYDKSGKAIKSYYVVVKGDVNGDGKVTSADVLFTQRHIIKTYTLSGAYFYGADINGDGKVSSVDVLYMQRHIIGTYTIKN